MMKKCAMLASLSLTLAVNPLLAFAVQPVAPVSKTPIPKTTQTFQQSVHTETQKAAQPAVKPLVPIVENTVTVKTSLSETWIEAQKSLIKRNYPKAISAFELILQTEPNNISALNGLANAFYSQGRYDEALLSINKAIKLDPINSPLFYTRGQILDRQDQALEAIEAYLTFTAMTPQDAAALSAERRVDELYKIVEPKLTLGTRYFFEGLLLLSLQQPEQAIPLFEKYKAIQPNSPEADLMLGKAYLDAGLPQKAIPFLESSIKLKADNPVAYYQLASVYETQGQSQSASEAYKKFLQFAPKSEAVTAIHQRIERKTLSP